MTTRSYDQYCGLAYALDVIGERWTLLIVRELIAGPRRFKDLMDGLPEISTNLLTERLKSLEQQGLLRRYVLPPPAASTVYGLTPLGMSLENALLELGKWGSQFVPPMTDDVCFLHLNSYALTPMTFFRADEAQGIDETYEIHVDDEVLHFQIQKGAIDVQQGEARNPDVKLFATMREYMGLLAGMIDPGEAVATGEIRVEGNLNALRHFLKLCALPGAIAAQEAA
jgi:DNA-binding HxlR family transcriptional regulator/putative sterol carrier protein